MYDGVIDFLSRLCFQDYTRDYVLRMLLLNGVILLLLFSFVYESGIFFYSQNELFKGNPVNSVVYD